MDFAKLVELFDKHQVTFVSVTQSFNTTTSMGRLTLNVLLSFAQFEREVTGERIRDKIAASKKKGIWMGGPIPLGYDLKDRNLLINEKEAGLVRKIYETYLKVRSVIKLIEILNRDGDKTKAGNNFSRGMLYTLLASPLYIGKLKHKSQIYEGGQKPIVSLDTWSAAQELLAKNAVEPRGKKKPQQAHFLRGLIFDAQGTIYSPVFTNKNGQRYRYYVSRDKIQNRAHLESIPLRIPAQEMEGLVEKGLRAWFSNHGNLCKIVGKSIEGDFEVVDNLSKRIAGLSSEHLFKSVSKIIVGPDTLSVDLSVSGLGAVLHEVYGLHPVALARGTQSICLEVPFRVGKSWHGAVIIRPPQTSTPEDMFDLPTQELRDLIRGFIWRDEHFNGMTIREIAKRDKRSDAFVGGMIRKTFEVA